MDSNFVKCASKISLDRDAAILEARRLGYPVAPYICPNGHDHWHVGSSTRNGAQFHNHFDAWNDRPRNTLTRCQHSWGSAAGEGT